MTGTALLFAALSALLASGAHAAAGRAEFVAGAATVSGADGIERALQRGAFLDSGETVRTAAEGRVQIRFTDGAYVSLQPNTEFSIQEYRFDSKPDGTERGFFALTRGAMRTVSGLVGRVNRDRYRISTPTATVGIRGTGGVIQVLNDGSTLVVGTSGIWSLTNSVGSIDVPAGVSALAPSAPGAPPQQTSQAPQSGPAPVPAQTVFTQSEQRTEAGAPTGITATLQPLVNAAGYSARVGHQQFGATLSAVDNASAVFDAAGQMTSLGTGFSLEPGGSHAESGTDGILAWGRWIGPVSHALGGTSIVKYPDNEGLHYVVGLPTPVLPTTGTATYSLMGATSPTYVNSNMAPGKFDGTITVGFGPNGMIDGNFKVAMPDASFAWTWRAPTAVQFVSQTSFSSGCTKSCVAVVNGFFSGADAERIGTGYSITEGNRSLLGAAAFRK